MTYSLEIVNKNSINYEHILFKLQRQSENAYKVFVESGNLVNYATALSEIVLNALDEGLCYPQFDIYKYLKEWTQVEERTN